MHMTVDIFLREALTGTVVTVDTLDDRTLRIPLTSVITYVPPSPFPIHFTFLPCLFIIMNNYFTFNIINPLTLNIRYICQYQIKIMLNEHLIHQKILGIQNMSIVLYWLIKCVEILILMFLYAEILVIYSHSFLFVRISLYRHCSIFIDLIHALDIYC